MEISAIYDFVKEFDWLRVWLIGGFSCIIDNLKEEFNNLNFEDLNFDNETLYKHSTLICVGTFICITFLTLILFFCKLRLKTYPQITFEACQSPDCVRCAKFKDILLVSFKRFQQYLKGNSISLTSTESLSYKRVLNSFEEIGFTGKKKNKPLKEKRKALKFQRPTVFTLVDVTSRPFWDDVYLMDVKALEDGFESILREFEKAFNLHDCEEMQYWTRNSTPTGHWSVFSLVNQGTPIERNLEICPNTWTIVSSLTSLMKDCVFENVVFSVVFPDTVITEHYGPTNTRVRCHLGLQIPDGCSLTVNGVSRNWKAGRCIVFDDSYLHSVQYKPTAKKSSVKVPQVETQSFNSVPNQEQPIDRSQLRAVLMVDLWHPWLTERERSALSYSFSTMGICSGKSK